ncbi:MAG: ABC transporter ATP-binding protein [Pyrinomonadaceae bacterium MAG19_C2-C3]|nr:ABC transporter ATP-binding protein [Pyrinomonadaceae bacterium MAG19_C2-C3]
MSLFVIDNLHKAFTDAAHTRIEVLRGVSLCAEAGETVAVTGASGTGKSTLLNIIGGMETADEGKVIIDDFDVTNATAAHLAAFTRTHIGFVFQFHHLLPDLTAHENVALPCLINRITRREAFKRADEMLESVNLTTHACHLPSELSGGERGRIAVARALVMRPRLIIADEPTGNLDEHHAAGVAALLLELTRAHNAIAVIATHNPILARACDRTLRLQDGRLG